MGKANNNNGDKNNNDGNGETDDDETVNSSVLGGFLNWLTGAEERAAADTPRKRAMATDVTDASGTNKDAKRIKVSDLSVKAEPTASKPKAKAHSTAAARTRKPWVKKSPIKAPVKTSVVTEWPKVLTADDMASDVEVTGNLSDDNKEILKDVASDTAVSAIPGPAVSDSESKGVIQVPTIATDASRVHLPAAATNSVHTPGSPTLQQAKKNVRFSSSIAHRPPVPGDTVDEDLAKKIEVGNHAIAALDRLATSAKLAVSANAALYPNAPPLSSVGRFAGASPAASSKKAAPPAAPRRLPRGRFPGSKRPAASTANDYGTVKINATITLEDVRQHLAHSTMLTALPVTQSERAEEDQVIMIDETTAKVIAAEKPVSAFDGTIRSRVTMGELTRKPSKKWGKLLSLFTSHPNVDLTAECITVGRHWRCVVQLLDPNVSRLFCRLVHENDSVGIESLSRNGKLFVNNSQVMPYTGRKILVGDKISIVASSSFSFVFTGDFDSDDEEAQATTLSAIEQRRITQANVSAPKADGKAVAVPPADTKRNRRSYSQQAVAKGTPVVQVSNPSIPPNAKEYDSRSRDKASADTVNEAQSAKMKADKADQEMLYTKLQDALKIVSGLWKEHFKAKMVKPEDITDVSFADFPYYIDPMFMEQLIQSVYIYLKHPDYVAHTEGLSTLNRGVSLNGPPGTSKYQEKVVRALAKHLGCNLLVFDVDDTHDASLKVEAKKLPNSYELYQFRTRLRDRFNKTTDSEKTSGATGGAGVGLAGSSKLFSSDAKTALPQDMTDKLITAMIKDEDKTGKDTTAADINSDILNEELAVDHEIFAEIEADDDASSTGTGVPVLEIAAAEAAVNLPAESEVIKPIGRREGLEKLYKKYKRFKLFCHYSMKLSREFPLKDSCAAWDQLFAAIGLRSAEVPASKTAVTEDGDDSNDLLADDNFERQSKLEESMDVFIQLWEEYLHREYLRLDDSEMAKADSDDAEPNENVEQIGMDDFPGESAFSRIIMDDLLTNNINVVEVPGDERELNLNLGGVEMNVNLDLDLDTLLHAHHDEDDAELEMELDDPFGYGAHAHALFSDSDSDEEAEFKGLESRIGAHVLMSSGGGAGGEEDLRAFIFTDPEPENETEPLVSEPSTGAQKYPIVEEVESDDEMPTAIPSGKALAACKVKAKGSKSVAKAVANKTPVAKASKKGKGKAKATAKATAVENARKTAAVKLEKSKGAVSASYTMLSLRTTINELEEYRCFYKGDKVAYRAPDSSHLTDPSTARGAHVGLSDLNALRPSRPGPESTHLGPRAARDVSASIPAELRHLLQRPKSNSKLSSSGKVVRQVVSVPKPNPLPPNGAKGEVVRTFPGSPNVGVCFSQRYLGCIEIGKYKNCFFVSRKNLTTDSTPQLDSLEDLAISALFDACAVSAPTILYVKDSKHGRFNKLFENKERLKRFTSEIAKLKKPVVVITENVDEAPDVLEPKGTRPHKHRTGSGGKSQMTSMMKNAIKQIAGGQPPQFMIMVHDHHTRDGAEPRASVKGGLRMTELAIKAPMDSKLLRSWDSQITADQRQTTIKQNTALLNRVLLRNQIRVTVKNRAQLKDLFRIEPMLENKKLTPAQADSIVGWAISHHLRMTAEAANPLSSKAATPEAIEDTPVALATEGGINCTDAASGEKSKDSTDADYKVAEVTGKERETEGARKTTSKKKGVRSSKRKTAAKSDDGGTTDSKKTKITKTKGKSKAVQGSAKSESKQKAVAVISTKKSDTILKLTLPALQHAILMFGAFSEAKSGDNKFVDSIKPENEYEEKLLASVIPADKIGVSFDDIGALEKVKKTLFELVILPLRRPELFTRGNLTKPMKGILLFGPPGTGKTLLAKAVATQSGANFLNITVSGITSKWMGEGEKFAKAVFTLATKIAPCVIFIDEIDSMLSRRDDHEHEGMRKIKNEFMAMWEGLTTNSDERVMVLGATNRPFDIDDAVLRRLPRRILVDLPDMEQRQQILKVLLRAEVVEEDFDYEECSKLLDGYTGSDIKNVCVAAAYQPIKEVIDKEELSDPSHNMHKIASVSSTSAQRMEMLTKTTNGLDALDDVLNARLAKQEKRMDVPELRALRIKDFEQAKKEVSASTSEDGKSIQELRKWNDQFGDGDKGKNWQKLTYFI